MKRTARSTNVSLRPDKLKLVLQITLLVACCVPAGATEWILPDPPARPYWGVSGGIVFTVWPGSIYYGDRDGLGGPRGLIRVGYESAGAAYMVNYIAVEPTVTGQRHYSELEMSQLDQLRGKRFWAVHPLLGPDVEPRESDFRPESTRLYRHPDGHEVLEVGIGVERFSNGAHPFLLARIDSRRPEELCLQVFAATGSADMRECVLTATMGNYIRARRLWLAGEVVESSQLYPGFSGNGFAYPTEYPRAKLLQQDGCRWAAITPDEADPQSVWPMRRGGWHFNGPPVTQYWRAPDDHPGEDLRVRVNGRATYYAIGVPVPGGVAYENFEMIRPFHPGQEFIFGITSKTPQQLGW